MAGFRYSWRKMEAVAQDTRWVEPSDLWTVIHWERQGITQVKSKIAGICTGHMNIPDEWFEEKPNSHVANILYTNAYVYA